MHKIDKEKIETLRDSLNRMVVEKMLTSSDILIISNKIDELINESFMEKEYPDIYLKIQ